VQSAYFVFGQTIRFGIAQFCLFRLAICLFLSSFLFWGKRVFHITYTAKMTGCDTGNRSYRVCGVDTLRVVEDLDE